MPNSVVPVIDLFAGPGGLGEGFSAFREAGRPHFKIRLSIEMDAWAHQTLLLRAFYRQFEVPEKVPTAYYKYLRGEILRPELDSLYPRELRAAANEARRATLGKTDPNEISGWISSSLGRSELDRWLLIGGPPCQAYSLVGRSRMIGEKGRQEFEKDHRHFLYREYLRIIARHQPAAFIMENVKGLLSARVNGEAMFPRIREDLQEPLRAFPELRSSSRRKNLRYSLFPIVIPESSVESDQSKFIVRSEDYGIPQARHRLIVLGLRSDYSQKPEHLRRQQPISVHEAIADLPRLRSGLSTGDAPSAWAAAIHEISRLPSLSHSSGNGLLSAALRSELRALNPALPRGGRFMVSDFPKTGFPRKLADPRLGGICNHETRSHIADDLRRYFFASVFAAKSNPPRSPVLNDFPADLLPDHRNISEALAGSKFNDRFRVQLADRPSTTVVSHISKDGHYYIHYDPHQCRSLTVREAARLQTFPDNYFFEGPRTEQYHQVGNAVPPLLARQIAAIVAGVL